MRVGTAVRFIIYIGIFLIVTGTILEGSLIKKAEDMGGAYSLNKVVISPRRPSETDFKSSISRNDAKVIAKAFEGEHFTLTSETTVKTSDMKQVNEIKLIGTDYMYVDFDDFTFVNGRFFDKMEDTSNSKVAVIDEGLAVDLFGSADIVGMPITISNKSFKVVGVYSVKDSFIDMLSDSGIHSVYVPDGAKNSLGFKGSANTVQIKSSGKGLSEGIAKTVLTSIGKSADEFLIKDYGTKKILMKQKESIIIFAFGIVCIVLIIIYVARRYICLFNRIRGNLKNSYPKDVFKNNAFYILRVLLEGMLASLVIWVIWRIVGVDVYIPKDNIPDQFIDFSFYFDLIKKDAQESVSNLGCIPIPLEIKLNNINYIIDWIFYLQLFAGLPLVMIGFYLLKLKNISFIAAYSHLSIIFGISVLVGLLFMPAGIPIDLNIYSLAVLYLFLMLTLFKFLKRKVNGHEEIINISSGSFNDI